MISSMILVMKHVIEITVIFHIDHPDWVSIPCHFRDQKFGTALTVRQKIRSQSFLLKSVLSKNFFLSRTMTVVAKNSPLNNYFSFQSLLLLQCIFIRLLLSIN